MTDEAKPLPLPKSKHERYDELMAPLSADPIGSLMQTPRHARNGQIGLRVDENEQRIISAIRDRYERKFGAAKSDQDVIRGIIRYMGKKLIEEGALDEAENIPELRRMAVNLRVKEKAVNERLVRDSDAASLEIVAREVTEFVAERLFAKAWRSVETFLTDVEDVARTDREQAAWMLELIHNQSGFVDAIEKLRGNGYSAALPVLD